MTDLPLSVAESVAELDGQPGLALTLRGAGPLDIEWSPESGRVHDLELRARIIATKIPPMRIPVIRYRVEFGHGSLVVVEPPPPVAAIAAVSGNAQVVAWSLPARGLVHRMSARALRVTFWQEAPRGGVISPASWECIVQASIQPARGAPLPVLPSSHYATSVVPARLQPFPQAAREWRLTDATGRPLALGAISVGCVGLCFAAIGTAAFDGADLYDWNPIPHDASYWVILTAAAECYAAYR